MDRTRIVIIFGIVIVLISLALLFFFSPFGANGSEVSIRENTLKLAEEYLENGDYQRALDLLDGLLIEDANDEAARELRDETILLRQLAMEEEKAAEAAAAGETDSREADFQEVSAEEAAAAERRRLEEKLRQEQEQADLEEQIRQAREARREEQERQERLTREEREKEQKVQRLIQEGLGLLNREDYQSARSRFEEAMNLDDSSAAAYAYMGEAFLREDDENPMNLRQAVEYTNRAIERDKNLWVPHNTLGKIYVQAENWEEAAAAFREASRLNPENGDILFQLGKAQYRARKFQDAQRSFERAIRYIPNEAKAHFNLGAAYVRLNNLNKALSAYKKAAEVNPSYASAHFSIAEVFRRQGNYREAQEYYKQAAALKPGDDRYILAMGINKYRLEDYSAAEADFRRILEHDPDLPEGNYNLALTLKNLGRPMEALDFAVKAIKLKPNSAPYYYSLGEISEELEQFDSAQAAYEKAVSLDSGYILPRINLGYLYDRKKMYDKALEHLVAAYRLEPESVEVNTNLGNVYLHAGLYKNAVPHYERALVKRPLDTLMKYHLAIANIELGEDAKAIAALEALIILDPNFSDAYYRLGTLYYKGGEAEKASQAFRTLLDKNPDYSKRAEIEPLILP